MPTTYSNTRIKINRSPKSPLLVLDDFEVGTVAPSCASLHVPFRIPNHHTHQASLIHKSMRSEHIQEPPATNQLNASIVPFSAFANSSTHTTYRNVTNRVPHTPKPNKLSPPPQAGTVVEFAKHRLVTHHVGATHHCYPATSIGDTLLKQQAILTINDLPSIITRLKTDLAEIKRARAGDMNATPKKTEQKPTTEEREQPNDANFFDASDDTADTDRASDHEIETQSDVDLLAKQMRDAENVLLRFDARSTRKVGAREIAELKQMGVVDVDTEAVTQREAHSAVTAEIAQLEAAIMGLGR
jgi:hypothetical protein